MVCLHGIELIEFVRESRGLVSNLVRNNEGWDAT